MKWLVPPLFLASLAPSLVGAQTPGLVYIVNIDGGPNVHFQDLQLALDSVPPSSVLVVQRPAGGEEYEAGDFFIFSDPHYEVQKPVAILGLGHPELSGLHVFGVTGTVVVADLEVGSHAGFPANSNSGTLVLDGVAPRTDLRLDNCSDVLVRRAELMQIEVERTTLDICDSLLNGIGGGVFPSLPGAVTLSTGFSGAPNVVTVALCDVLGMDGHDATTGVGGCNDGQDGRAAFYLETGLLDVRGHGRNLVVAGAGGAPGFGCAGGAPGAAIQTPTTFVPPQTTLSVASVGLSGEVNLHPDTIVVVPALTPPSLRATRLEGGAVRFELWAHPNEDTLLQVTATSPGRAAVPLATAPIETDAKGFAAVTIPIPTLPVGSVTRARVTAAPAAPGQPPRTSNDVALVTPPDRRIYFQPCHPGAVHAIEEYHEASFDGSTSAVFGSTIVDWSWDFGDGGTGSGPTPTHLYGPPGTYVVALTTTDAQGRVTTCETLQQVLDNPIECSFTTQTFFGTNVLFQAVFSTSVFDFQWDFGDGQTASGSSLDSILHSYAAPGTYLARLTIVTSAGGGGIATYAAEITLP